MSRPLFDAGDLPDEDDGDFRTAIHEAAHAVAVVWTGVGRVESVEVGLQRTRPEAGLSGLVRWRGYSADGEAALAASEAGRAVLGACLVVYVAAPLAVARATGRRDLAWVFNVEGHRRHGPGWLAGDRPRRPDPDYAHALRLCGLLGITIAEGMVMGEAFLDEPGVMEAIRRVAAALLADGRGGRLDGRAFLAVLRPPAHVRARRRAARWAAVRVELRRSEEGGAGVGLAFYVVLHVFYWIVLALM